MILSDPFKLIQLTNSDLTKIQAKFTILNFLAKNI
jgi:hypothetical protein